MPSRTLKNLEWVSFADAFDALPQSSFIDFISAMERDGWISTCNNELWFNPQASEANVPPAWVDKKLPKLVANVCADIFSREGVTAMTTTILRDEVNRRLPEGENATRCMVKALVPSEHCVAGMVILATIPAHQPSQPSDDEDDESMDDNVRADLEDRARDNEPAGENEDEASVDDTESTNGEDDRPDPNEWYDETSSQEY